LGRVESGLIFFAFLLVGFGLGPILVPKIDAQSDRSSSIFRSNNDSGLWYGA